MTDPLPLIALPPGFRLSTFDCIDSTNAEALRRLADGSARHFDAVVAASQTAGRGRRERRWFSPPGNLYLTIVVVLPGDAPAGQLAFVAALGLGDAIAALLPASVQLRFKWPNDLLVDGRKLAGVLIEGGETERSFAVGIGVNVTAAPAGTETPATALSQAGVAIAPAALAAPVCAGFARWYEHWRNRGFAPLRTAWLARAQGLGETIAARLPDGAERHGVFRDLDRNGALVLETTGGGRSVVAAGEVFFAAA